jgi:hydroxymethylpyrimidine/phosphomethylpyrimidine kinase
MAALPPIVLTFAASDPTGGAGLQADVLTIASQGCHPLSVLTGFTVQDSSGVDAFEALEARWVSLQARTLLADMRIGAFKLGVLGSEANVRAIAEIVTQHADVPLVLDPVLASGRGDQLASDAAVAALLELIVPRATIATPNTMEARRLGGERRLLALGCKYVLLTGTHEDTAEVINTLYGADGAVREERWRRLAGSYHGSGCTLASAIACGLAKGWDMEKAVHEAQAYTWRALKDGFRPGKGQLLPKRSLQ